MPDIVIPPVLNAMLSEHRLVHALCLEGEPEQSLALAHALAGGVLCERQQGPMCGECLACRKVLAGVHSDITQADQAEGGYKKDAVRALRAAIYRSPSEGRVKVLICREAQDMSAEVQNLLLKVLEEPPADTYFILTCDNRYRLLTTLLSRMASVTLPGKSDDLLLDDLLAADRGQSAKKMVEAMTAGGGYPLLAALQPLEKTRADYTALLQTADRLLGLPRFRREAGISTQRCLRFRSAISEAIGRNERNGYLPVISAALAERVLHG